jgi:hypothetical protein
MSVRLLPAYDQWLLGPGTADAHIVPPSQRTLVSRGANVIVVGGVVSGTWSIRNDRVSIDWFAGAPPSAKALGDEVARLASILGRRLESSVG